MAFKSADVLPFCILLCSCSSIPIGILLFISLSASTIFHSPLFKHPSPSPSIQSLPLLPPSFLFTVIFSFVLSLSEFGKACLCLNQSIIKYLHCSNCYSVSSDSASVLAGKIRMRIKLAYISQSISLMCCAKELVRSILTYSHQNGLCMIKKKRKENLPHIYFLMFGFFSLQK